MSRPVLLLYERRDCGLCEEAAALLRPLALRFGFDVQRIDIDRDPLLQLRLGEAVPVVALPGGEELARAPIDATRLQDRIAALSHHTGP